MRRSIIGLLLPATLALAQSGPEKLKIDVEFRSRYESRTGVRFGSEPDKTTALVRTRVGLSYRPARWLRVSAMVQDSRAPFYGPNAPPSVRDQADWHEGSFELFPEAKQGVGLSAGRSMLNYGEARLIGSPQWGNLSRTFDFARASYRLAKARFEWLFVSPVRVRSEDFNRPALGDHLWGSYNTFSDLPGGQLVEAYALRRHGAGRIRVNTFGFRLAGPLGAGCKHSLEGAVQTGRSGPADHRAGAWFSGLSRSWQLWGRRFELGGEYKYASGTRQPANAARTSTFDQLFPANHDKFGHQDLFGWRNIHNLRSLATVQVRKRLAASLMYNSFWLASARDALYDGSGRAVARSAAGAAGRHVGQEVDLFATYRHGDLLVGAGYGHFHQGGFVRRATPGISPVYLYVFHTYSFGWSP